MISTQLQLSLGTVGVRETDLLDALQASRQALTNVANSRIGYLVDRCQFVLDLELLQLDDDGYWPPINDLNHQFEADLIYPVGAGPTYGYLPPWLKLSEETRDQLRYPAPGAGIRTIEPADFGIIGHPSRAADAGVMMAN